MSTTKTGPDKKQTFHYDVDGDDNLYRNGSDNPLTYEADNVEYAFYAMLLEVKPIPGIGISLD